MASKRKIGAIIALDGEKEFKSSVTSCNKSLSTLKSEMNLVKAETAGSANSLENLKKKHEVLTKTLDEHVKKEQVVQTGLDHAKEQYERVGSELTTYKKRLEEAQKTLQQMEESGTASEEEMQKQRDTVSELSEVVEQGSKTYDTAGGRVKDWEKQLNNAKAQTIHASKAVEENVSYMREAENSADGCATSIDNFGKKVNSTARETKNLNENLTGFEKLEIYSQYFDKFSDAAKNLAGNMYNAALELDEGYDTIITKTGATGDALDGLTEVADNIFGDLPVEMADVGTAVGEVNTRFGQTGDVLEKTSKQYMEFAEINGTDLNESIDATDRIMTQFNVDVSHSGELLGLLTKRGQETGKSVSNLMSELDSNAATFKELNLDVVEAANLLAVFETNGVDAGTAMRGLKTAVNEYAKEGMSAREGLEATIQSIKNAETNTEALAIAQEVFGTKGAQVMSDGIRDGRINLDNLSESMSAYGTTVENTFQATQDPWDQAKIAANNLKTAGSELTGEFLTAVSPAIVAVTGAVKDATKWFRGLPGPVKTVVSVVGAVGVGAGVAAPKVLKLVTTIKTLKTANEAAKALKAVNDVQKTTAAVSGAAAAAEELNTVAKTKGAAASGASAAGAAVDSAAKGVETAATGAATVAQTGLNTAMNACPALLLVTGIGALIGVVAAFASGSGEAATETEKLWQSADIACDKLAESQEELRTAIDTTRDTVEGASGSAIVMSDAVRELEGLANQTELTSAEQERMAALVTELNTVYPELGLQIDAVTGKLNMGTEEIQNYVDNMGKMAEIEAYKQGIQESIDQATTATKARIDAEKELAPLLELKKNLDSELTEITETLDKRGSNLNKSQAQLNEELKKGLITQEDYDDAISGVVDNTIEYNGVVRDANDVQAELNQQYWDNEKAIEELEGKIEDQNGLIEEANANAEEYSEGLNELNGVTQEATVYAEDYVGSQAGVSGASEAAAGNVYAEAEAFNALDQTTQEKAVSVAEAVIGMQEAVTGAVQSQMDIFAEFQAAEEVQTQSILDNMQSQVDGFNQWGEQLATLGETTKTTADGVNVTINEGLLQHLAEMGPEGAGYVAAFNEMTAEELQQANSLWEQSVDIGSMTTGWGEQLKTSAGTLAAGGAEAFQQLGDQLKLQANDAGMYTGQGLVEGLKEIQDQVNTAGEEMGNDLIENLNLGSGVASPSWKSKQSGMYIDIGLSQGIRGSADLVKNASEAVGKAAVDKIDSAIDEDTVKSYGYNVSAGLAEGIRNGKSEVINAVIEVTTAATETARGKLEINSPSHVFERFGAGTIEGYAKGVDENAEKARKSIINALDMKLASRDAKIQTGVAGAVIDYNLLTAAMVTAFKRSGMAIKYNGREFGRVLSDMGVAFNNG